jgi:clan AA aspartic protease
LAVIGLVTARREAVIRLSVSGTDERRIEVEAILDTGFTGYLTFPGTIFAELALPSQGVREVVLADGSRVALAVYRAGVLWDGEPREVQVLASEGAPLVGMSLLYGHEVRIGVVEGGSVVIERLA